jgi:hypothetical protein
LVNAGASIFEGKINVGINMMIASGDTGHSENACAEGTLERGRGSYHLCARDPTAARRGGPPSMALRAFHGF